MSSVTSTLSSAWGTAKSKLPDGVKNVFSNVKSGLLPVFDFIKKTVVSIKDKLSDKLKMFKEATATEEKGATKYAATNDPSEKKESVKLLTFEEAADKTGNVSEQIAGKSDEEIKQVYMQAENTLSKNAIMYFNEREEYNSELKSAGDLSDKIQEMKDKHLKKTDGTYFSSIEEKYGFDNTEIDLSEYTKESFFNELNIAKAEEQISSVPVSQLNHEFVNWVSVVNTVSDNHMSAAANQDLMNEYAKNADQELKSMKTAFDPEKAAMEAALGHSDAEHNDYDTAELSTDKQLGY